MRTCSCGYPVFGTDKITGIGYCKMHQSKRTDLDRRSSAQKIMEKIKESSKPGKVAEVIEKTELELYFDEAAVELKKKPYCENCGEFIPEKYYRHATAHLYPKKTFPSIASNPLNRIFAGAGCGCHNETHRWDTMQKMNCFPTILKKMIELYPLISEDEKRNVPDFITQEIQPV